MKLADYGYLKSITGFLLLVSIELRVRVQALKV